MTDLSLAILLTAQDQASKVISGLASSLGPVGSALAVAGTAAVAFGVQSVKMAGDFQKSVTTLVTSAGESASNLKMVSDGILNISQETGTSTEQLSHGMYMIESSGLHGAAGLAALQAAAMGAKAENADLSVVTRAMTTIMTDYAAKHVTAAQAMNALTTTVANGKTNLQGLASSMGTVLPLASSLGISFPQVAGAMAVMTNSGMSAQRASMNLANSIRSLAAPSGVAQKSMAAVGLTAQQVKDTLSEKGLSGAIQLVEDHVGKKFPAGSVEAVTAFKNIMGGATGYNVALMVGGQHMKTYESNIDAITKAMGASGDKILGWEEAQTNLNVQMDRVNAAFNAFKITVGTALLPAVTSLMSHIAPLITGFAQWETKTHTLQNAVSMIGDVIKNVVTVGSGLISFFQHNQVAMAALIVVVSALRGALTLFVVAGIARSILSMMDFGLSILTTTAEAATGATTMISTFSTMAGMIATSMGVAASSILATLGPFLLVGAAIGVVTVGVILAIQHWGEISTWLSGVWQNATALWSRSIQVVGAWMKQNQIIVDAFAAAIIGVAAAFIYANAGVISGFVTSIVQLGIKLAAVAQVQIAEFIASLGTMKTSLIATATTAVADFIASIPGLVAGFGAWAVGAGSAAIATIAASLPLIAIGAAVAAAVFLIILAIQHWGEISTWLQQQWQRFTSWFSGVMQSLARIPAIAALIQTFQTAWTNISSAARTAWSNVTTTVGNALNGLKQKGGEVGNWFQQTWQNISTQAQQKLGPPLQSAWDNIKRGAQQAGMNISQFFQNAWSNVQKAWQQSPLAGAWNTMVLAFRNLGPVIMQTLQQQFGPIGQIFARLGPTFSTQLKGALAGIQPALTNLGNSFKQIWQTIQPLVSLVGQGLTQAWKQLQPALASVGQAIGGSFVSAWKSIQQAFVALQPALSAVSQAVGGAFSSAWKALAPALTQVSQAVSGAFVSAWKTLAPVLVQVGQAVGGAFSTAWKTLAPILSQIAQVVGGALSTAWKALQPILAQIGQAIGGQLLTALQAIGIVIGGVVLLAISLLLGAIVGIAKALATFIQGIATTIAGIVQIFSGIAQIVSGFVALIVDLCTGNFGKLGADLGVIWNGVVTMFKGIWTTIQGIFQATIGTVTSFISGFVTTIIQFFTNLYNSLVGHSIIPDMLKAIVTAFTQFFANIIAGITAWVASVIQWFTQMWTLAQNLFKMYSSALIVLLQQAWTTIWTNIQTAWNNIWAWIAQWWATAQVYYKAYAMALEVLLQQAWTNIKNNVMTAWNGIIDWLKSAATNIQNAIENPFKTAIDFVTNLWNGLKSTISNVVNGILDNINKVTSALGGAKSSASSGGNGGVSLGARAAGGTNLPAGWNVIGEEGPELMWVPGGSTILPNSSYKAINTPSSVNSSGIGAISITVNAPQRSANEAKAIADAVSKELAKRYRLQFGTISMGGSNI